MNVIGDVSGKACVLVDDIVDSGGTLTNAAVVLKEKGATDVSAYVVSRRPVRRGGQQGQEFPLSKLVISDSIPATDAMKPPKISSRSALPT
jgi:ribose-phosphate pyrophosphokinase